MKITANGIKLHYKKSGTGPPLILLHGNGETLDIFHELGIKLANHFTVYAIDSRNHGQSEITDDYSYDTMSEDIRSFITTLELGAVSIVGFSDGAIISLILAMKHENLVHKMALLGVNLKPDDFTDESLEYLKETYQKTGDPLMKLMLEQPNIELTDLTGLQTPTLIVAGDDDIFRPETFTAIADTLPHAELKIMEGHQHDSYITNQDILYPDLISFFL